MDTTLSPALVSWCLNGWLVPPFCVSTIHTSTTLIFPCTVESHLSELQLSKHKGCLNTFAEATPTISGYFYQREVLGVQMADIECFSRTLHVTWQLETQDNFYGQGRLLNKGKSNCQSEPLGTTSLPHVPSGNWNRATVYGCVHSSACYMYIHSVQKLTFRLVQSEDVSHTTDNSTSAAHR